MFLFQINIVIFVNVIRILVEKLKSSAMTGNNDTGHFMWVTRRDYYRGTMWGTVYNVVLVQNFVIAGFLKISCNRSRFSWTVYMWLSALVYSLFWSKLIEEQSVVLVIQKTEKKLHQQVSRLLPVNWRTAIFWKVSMHLRPAGHPPNLNKVHKIHKTKH